MSPSASPRKRGMVTAAVPAAMRPIADRGMAISLPARTALRTEGVRLEAVRAVAEPIRTGAGLAFAVPGPTVVLSGLTLAVPGPTVVLSGPTLAVSGPTLA